MSHYKKFKKGLSSKEKFYSSLTDRKVSDKEYDYVFNFWKSSVKWTILRQAHQTDLGHFF